MLTGVSPTQSPVCVPSYRIASNVCAVVDVVVKLHDVVRSNVSVADR